MTKPIKIEFAPGCFDGFEGTQEELDQMIAEIQRLAESGELFERSTPVDMDTLDDLLEDMDESEQDALFRAMGAEEATKRWLN